MGKFKFAIDISNVKKYDELSQIVEQLAGLRKLVFCDTMNSLKISEINLIGGRYDIYTKT